MNKLLMLEFMKLKRTVLIVLIPLSLILPLVLVLVQYGFDQQNTFTSLVTKNSVFVQMIAFAAVVISGCFIIAREYKNNLISYLAITPKSLTQILLCKYILLFLEIAILQVLTFGLLIIVNTSISGFDAQIAVQYLTAGMLSTIFLFCLTPAVGYIALLKRNFSSSALIFLIIFMLTYPFAFTDYGYILPHLAPIIMVSKFLGNEQYAQISYGAGSVILFVVFSLFLYLSINQIRKKE